MRSGHGWAIAKTLAEKHGGGIYIRLANDKDKMIAKLSGEPYACEMHWTGEGYDDCKGPGCPRCGKDKLTTRIKLNVYVVADGAMKIFEFGPALFTDLENVKEKFSPDKFLFEIQRHGAAKSTKTRYTVLPDKEIASLPADVRERMAAAALHNLETTAEDAEEHAQAPAAADPTAPLSPAAAAEFRERLKRFSKEQGLYPVLGTFGAERISDLLAKDEHKTRALIERIERGEKLVPPPSEIDEFA